MSRQRPAKDGYLGICSVRILFLLQNMRGGDKAGVFSGIMTINIWTYEIINWVVFLLSSQLQKKKKICNIVCNLTGSGFSQSSVVYKNEWIYNQISRIVVHGELLTISMVLLKYEGVPASRGSLILSQARGNRWIFFSFLFFCSSVAGIKCWQIHSQWCVCVRGCAPLWYFYSSRSSHIKFMTCLSYREAAEEEECKAAFQLLRVWHTFISRTKRRSCWEEVGTSS